MLIDWKYIAIFTICMYSSTRDISDMENAMSDSRKMFQINTILKKHHESRLNNLLISNNLEKVEIPPDGNCFFNAVSCQTTVDSTLLRDRLESIRSSAES